ncbi:MAG: hypothetical protein ACYCPT_09860 [Acidimicrobiales bacterium]
MNVPTTIDAGAWLSKYLEGANGDTDLTRSMLGAFAEAIRNSGVDAVQRWLRRTIPERENSRNGYRTRLCDTRLVRVESSTQTCILVNNEYQF